MQIGPLSMFLVFEPLSGVFVPVLVDKSAMPMSLILDPTPLIVPFLGLEFSFPLPVISDPLAFIEIAVCPDETALSVP